LLNILVDEGVKLIFSPHAVESLSGIGVELPTGYEVKASLVDCAGCVDIALSIGGDGTFLRTAEWVGSSEIPILGINTGHLGFLSNYTLDKAVCLIADLKQGCMKKERRIVLSLESDYLPDGFYPYCLNEVAILRDDTSSMITVNTLLDDYLLADYLADGLVISTPTGSTGYNLSVGGPMLQPTLDCLAVSPIAPHSLTVRPLVVNSASVIKAKTMSRASSYRVSIDGRSFTLPCNTTITVRRAPFDVITLRLAGDNFAATLRNKLLWGRR
jgi:NAD+ kinase